MNVTDFFQICKYAYGYQYDQLNQLKSAKFAYWTTQGWSADDKYSTNSITYDLNGNIKTISQNWNGALADNLTYAYNGNKLIGVNDAVNNSACTNDFEDNGMKLTPVDIGAQIILAKTRIRRDVSR